LPLVPTRYDSSVDRLQKRIKQGANDPQKLRGKLQNQRARQYLAQEQKRPETPLPYSSAYESAVGRANRDLSSSQSDITGRELATEQQYGFGSDQSNPFSRANALQRSFNTAQKTTTNVMAGRGQLYSGATSNARAADRFGFEQSLDSSQREYLAALANYSRERTGAQSQYDETIAGAEAARLEEGLQNRPEASEAPPTPKFVKDFKKMLKRKDNKGKGGKGHNNHNKKGH
jgi:hypothetical protein